MRKYIAALFVIGLVLTGCGARQETATSTPTPTPNMTKTAGQIATAMKTRLPQVSEVIVWTETNDPSRLLGRCDLTPCRLTALGSRASARVSHYWQP